MLWFSADLFSTLKIINHIEQVWETTHAALSGIVIFMVSHPTYFIVWASVLGSILVVFACVAIIYQWQNRHSVRFRARSVFAQSKKGIQRFAFLLGIKWTKEKTQAFLVFASGIFVVFLSTIINPPGFWEARLGVQVYILILTATLPAVIFILTLASRLPETYNPFGAFFRLTSVKAIIKGELFFLLVLLLLPKFLPGEDSAFMLRTSWFLCLWAGLLSIYLVSKVLSGVVDRKLIWQAGKTVNQEQINFLMDQQGVATMSNLMYKELRDKLHIETYPIFGFEQERTKGFSDVITKREGTIVDIDPLKLARLSKRCNGAQNILMHPGINFDVTRNTPLIAIRKTFLNKKIERMARKVFEIQKQPTIPQSFEQGLQDIQQNFLNLVDEGFLSEAKDTLDFYYVIWKKLLGEEEHLVDEAESIDRLKVTENLYRIFEYNLRKLVHEATRQIDSQATFLIFDMLERLSEEAFEAEIPQSARDMSMLYLLIYINTKTNFPTPTKKKIVTKIWNALQNLGRLLHYYYLGDLRRKEIYEDFTEMCEVPLIVLNHLAKSAIDSSLESDYEKFIATITGLKIYDNPETDFRSRSLPNETFETRKTLWKFRNTCFMGLGGWVIERFRDKTIGKDAALRMLGQLHIPFNDFLDVVFRPIDNPEESRFGWGNWGWKYGDQEPRPGYDLRSRVGSPSWVYDFFLLEAVKSWKKLDVQEVFRLEPPAKLSIHFLREHLERRLNQVINDPSFKLLIRLPLDKPEEVEEQLEKAVKAIKNYLERMELIAQHEEKKWVRNQEINKNKYKTIKENFTIGFDENAILRHILEKYHSAKVSRRKQKIPEGLSPVYRLKDIRSRYFPGEDVAGFGKEIGERWAGHESIRIIRQLQKNQKPTILQGDAKEVIDNIESEILDMKEQNSVPMYIILLGHVFDWRSGRILYRHKHYKETPEEKKRFPNQLGTFLGVPILRMWWGEQEPILLLLAPKTVLIKNAKLGEGYKGIFKFRFNDMAIDEKAIELLKKDKSWLEDKNTKKQRSKEEAILEIQQRVFVEIYEQFEVEAIPKGVRFFKVKVKDKKG